MDMKREDARREIRARWREIITEYTDKARDKANGKTSYICPFCGHGTNGDGLTHNPKSTDGNALKCFGCGWSGDILDLIQAHTGADYNTALAEAARTLNINIERWQGQTDPKEDFDIHNLSLPELKQGDRKPAQETTKTGPEAGPISTGKGKPDAATNAATGGKSDGGKNQKPAQKDLRPYYSECFKRLESRPAVDYLQGRGISLETARRFKIGFDPVADPAGKGYKAARLIIPITKGHYIGRSIDPNMDRNYRAMNNAGAEIGIFNALAITKAGDGPIFVTEGVFDALAIIEAGGEAVALNSTSNADKFIDLLKERPQEAAHPYILTLDNDEAGQKATRKIAGALAAGDVPFIEGNINGGQKDPNDALKADRERFSDAVRKEAERATARANMDDLDQFLERIQTTAYKPYQTGLNFFDRLLGGGMIRQTVILILAAPGSGKTTLCQQIAEELAARKKPVIFLNLEMSKDQMIAKAISARASRSGKNKITALDILQGYKWTQDQRSIIMDTLKEYREKIFPYMKYNPAGIDGDLDNIRNYLEAQGQEAKENGTEAPAVVLDYLHLVSTSKGLDVQELIKQTLAEIKQYAMKYNTFGIVISASNRAANRSGTITLDSGRDSSNIEYGCDAQISLNFWDFDQSAKSGLKPTEPADVQALQSEPYRRMVLRVLKARFYDPSLYAKVYFHAATNQFFGEDDFIPFDENDPDAPRPRPFNLFTLDPDAGNYDLNNLELSENSGTGKKGRKGKRQGQDVVIL